jgi:hypothetical protein
MGSCRLAGGCEFTYEAQVAILVVFPVQPGASMLFTRESESWVSTPELAVAVLHRRVCNPCMRVMLPAGWSSLRLLGPRPDWDAVEDADESAGGRRGAVARPRSARPGSPS